MNALYLLSYNVDSFFRNYYAFYLKEASLLNKTAKLITEHQNTIIFTNKTAAFFKRRAKITNNTLQLLQQAELSIRGHIKSILIGD
jgi:hypothetical protein